MRRWCMNDGCIGQRPQMSRGYVYLIRFSTTREVHRSCPHCEGRLFLNKPSCGGAREIGPASAAEQVREYVESGRALTLVPGAGG